VTTKNRGGGSAGASVTRLYLSTNGKLDASDDLLGTISVPVLPAGQSHAVTGFSVTIPPGTATGARNFLIVADAADAVAETKETNTIKSPVTINP
jgi:hypothetical protein